MSSKDNKKVHRSQKQKITLSPAASVGTIMEGGRVDHLGYSNQESPLKRPYLRGLTWEEIVSGNEKQCRVTELRKLWGPMGMRRGGGGWPVASADGCFRGQVLIFSVAENSWRVSSRTEGLSNG